MFLLPLLLAACLTSCSSIPGGTPRGAVVGRYDVYDYSPSVIQTGTVQQFWWCGRGVNPARHSQKTDTILYESIDLATGETVGPEIVLGETPGAWDSEYICNPQVIRGTFNNPLSDGQTYTYAMYYVGTETGTNNSIGVAFSNDGIAWNKFPQPVIPSTYSFGYGPAQPVPYNSDQKQAVVLFYEDDDPSGPADHHIEASSSDGVHFQDAGALTTKGLDLDNPAPSWGDMAYSPSDGSWYAVFNLPSRGAATTGNIRELGSYGIQLYRIPAASLLTGQTPWQLLKTFDSNSSGYENVFIAGLLRDPYGNVYGTPSGKLQLYPSFSNNQLAWNVSPEDAGKSADSSHWDIGLMHWSASDDPQMSLNRYSNGTTHVVTSGWIDPAGNFHLEQTLGRLYAGPQNGATTALYSCKGPFNDQFVSLDPGCEGKYVVGVNGYFYSAPVSGLNLSPIYRCLYSGGHFASKDAGCEGYATEMLLGYILP